MVLESESIYLSTDESPVKIATTISRLWSRHHPKTTTEVSLSVRLAGRCNSDDVSVRGLECRRAIRHKMGRQDSYKTQTKAARISLGCTRMATEKVHRLMSTVAATPTLRCPECGPQWMPSFCRHRVRTFPRNTRCKKKKAKPSGRHEVLRTQWSFFFHT